MNEVVVCIRELKICFYFKSLHDNLFAIETLPVKAEDEKKK